MKVGKYIFSVLSNTTAVTDITAERIYPNTATQSSTFPFIVYSVQGVEPADTKDGVSSLDTNVVTVVCFCETYTQGCDLADAVRTALDRTSLTREGIEVQSVQFTNYDDDFEPKSNNEGIYIKSLDFRVRQIIT
jgi:hypothetical protein